MRALFIFSLLSIYLLASCQRQPQYYDSLKKYSYLIFGLYKQQSDTQYLNGTGFFIRKGGALFFVTAVHVLNKCNPLGRKELSPDEMDIFIKLRNNSLYKYHIDTRIIKDTSRCPIMAKIPDFIVLEINDTVVINNVYSVEEFIHPLFPHYKNAIFIGFDSVSISELKRNKQTQIPRPSYINFPEKTYSVDQLFMGPREPRDLSNYYIFPTATKIDSGLGGFSGSPIFLQDSITLEWCVMSIVDGISASTTNELFLYGSTIDYVLADINAKLSSRGKTVKH